MDSYGIECIEVDRAITRGMKWKEKNSEKWHARTGGLECVFVKQENSLVVITVYLGGGKK